MQRRAFLFLLTFVITTSSKAQIDIGLGPELGFPLLYNKSVGSYNHSLGSPGLRATLAYTPDNVTFTPSLVVGISSVRLPVSRFSSNAALYMNFTYSTAILNGRLRKVWNNEKEFQYGAGIGIGYLSGNGVGLAGRENISVQLLPDSSELIKIITPIVNVNAEYIVPISSQVPLFAGIGGQIQYTYFYDRGRKYNINIQDDQGRLYFLQPSLYGHTILPSVYVTVYYRFGERNYY